MNTRTSTGKGEVPADDDVGSADREVQIKELIDLKLKAVENARLRVTVGGEEIVVIEQVRKLVHTILSAKDYIGSAVSVEPHAALAWAGVLVFLPVSFYIMIYFSTLVLTSASQLLLNPVTQDEAALEGLGYISDLLVRCKVREDIYLEEYRSAHSIPDQRYLINFPR